nr:putative holin [Mycolicibacterium palauense]
MIPLPRPWWLTSAMLVGWATGLMAGIVATLLVTAPVRPDVAIALALGVPGVAGLAAVLFSAYRWVTAFGAFLLALGPGWFVALVLMQVMSGG